MSALPLDPGDLLPGTIAVHNDVPETRLGRLGFQCWTEPEGALPRERCYCGEVPGPHYITRRWR